MKIAFYMEDGIEQIVLTPEREAERKMLAYLHDASRTVDIKRGQFYENRGGWVRHGYVGSGPYGSGDTDDSTILVLRKKPETVIVSAKNDTVGLDDVPDCDPLGPPRL